jgi:HAD superfamily hydrolase (TIGR01509 family)
MLRAVFFDLDGLLVDTEPYYYEAARSVFAEHGHVLSREDYAIRWIIRGTRMVDEARRLGIKGDPDALVGEIRRRFRAMVERELRLMPLARETLETASSRFATALVTNTVPEEVELILGQAGIRPLLHHLITRGDYPRPKPAPDCYLAAARRVGCAPGECLALEDAARGVRAAVAAGVPCVAVLNEMTRYEPPEGALLTLNSLGDLDLDSLAANWRSGK